MKLLKNAIMPEGFKCVSKNCGMKNVDRDLSLFYSKVRTNAAGVFTNNKFPGAPVMVGRDIIKQGFLRAIIVNSKVSNVGTGQQGMQNARRMAQAVAREFKIPAEEVLMSSTGVIAQQLPIELIENGVKGMSRELTDDPVEGVKGMMTTDTYPKALSLAVDKGMITIVGKGSGMIEPNMATMLVYIFTDLEIERSKLDAVLRETVNDTFNMLSIDSDTSTSDTCIAMANGLAGQVNLEKFREAFRFVCLEMTKMLARDGEGASKLLLVNVAGAATQNEARVIAKSIVNSPLIKTMAYGADPNIGRILMATGKCTACQISPEKIEISINDQPVYRRQSRVDFNEDKVRQLLSGDTVKISVHLQVGPGKATAYGCDLTEGYIKENAAYYSS